MLLALFNHKMSHLSLFFKVSVSGRNYFPIIFQFATQFTQALNPDRIGFFKKRENRRLVINCFYIFLFIQMQLTCLCSNLLDNSNHKGGDENLEFLS